MNFRAIGGREQDPDLVRCTVKLGRFAAGSAVEQIDQPPGDVFAVGFERGIGKEREEIGPDGTKCLRRGILGREVSCIERCRSDSEACQVEVGKLGSEAVIHIENPP